ncbi:MAG: cytochrome c biogenesis protein CcdA [Chloroflexi bacterium]|nr:cytochrome c biogenesis protein CcdA [Chloroflexota bacterium]
MTAVVPEPGWGVAFAAGVVSFLSPCVAPLAPGYLAYITGTALEDGAPTGARASLKTLSTSLLFMLGFTFVFVSLGTSISFFGSLLEEHRATLYQVAGVVMISFGLVLTGLPRLAWLQREWRPNVSADAFGPAAPVLLGMVFALAWTPCVGPILGSILFYAGATETAGRGGLLLLVYSLGFAVPFLLAALGLSSAVRIVSWMRRHSVAVNAFSGATLMAVGVLLLLGEWSSINLWFQRTYYTLT